MSDEKKASKWEISNAERISGLEKKIKDEQFLSRGRRDDLSNEIDSLRERLTGSEKITVEQLTELKEQIDSLFNSVRFQRIENLEKVLRELGKKVYDYLGAQYFGSWNDFITKLDKTEKKDIVSVDMRETFPELYNEDGTSKDEKPPKPKYAIIQGEKLIQSTSPESDRRYGIPKEPREDEGTITYEKGDIFITYKSNDYKIVKREYLQKLFDWINRFPVDWDEFIRLKGEYNIK